MEERGGEFELLDKKGGERSRLMRREMRCRRGGSTVRRTENELLIQISRAGGSFGGFHDNLKVWHKI